MRFLNKDKTAVDNFIFTLRNLLKNKYFFYSKNDLDDTKESRFSVIYKPHNNIILMLTSIIETR